MSMIIHKPCGLSLLQASCGLGKTGNTEDTMFFIDADTVFDFDIF
jgi:hypothetical protein